MTCEIPSEFRQIRERLLKKHREKLCLALLHPRCSRILSSRVTPEYHLRDDRPSFLDSQATAKNSELKDNLTIRKMLPIGL